MIFELKNIKNNVKIKEKYSDYKIKQYLELTKHHSTIVI